MEDRCEVAYVAERPGADSCPQSGLDVEAAALGGAQCGEQGAVGGAIVHGIAVPAARWPHGRWSQLAWIAAAIWADGRLGAWYVPAGALVAIWRTHRLARPTPPDPAPLPLADSSPTPEEDTHDRHQH